MPLGILNLLRENGPGAEEHDANTDLRFVHDDRDIADAKVFNVAEPDGRALFFGECFIDQSPDPGAVGCWVVQH